MSAAPSCKLGLPIAALITILVHVFAVTTEIITVLGTFKLNAKHVPKHAINSSTSDDKTTVDAYAIDPRLGKAVDSYAKEHGTNINSSAIDLGVWGPLIKNPYMEKKISLSVVDALQHASRDGAWLLGMVVATLGIMWPLLQLIALLKVVLFAHLGWVSVNTCRSIMDILIPLSKGSMFCVFLILSAAVIVDATSPETSIKIVISKHHDTEIRADVGNFVIDLQLKCLPCLALFCLTLMLSTALVHWADHALVGHTATASPTECTGLLVQDGVEFHHSASNSEATSTDHTLLLAVATLSLLVMGVSRTLVSIERQGSFGKALQASADRDVSVLGMMRAVFSMPHLRLQPLMIMMAGLLIVLVLVVPLLELVLLVQSARRCIQGYSHERVVALRLFGLDCLEVFLMSTAILYADLGEVINNEADQHCSHDLVSNEKLLAQVGLLHLKDDDCFVQTIRLGIGWWFLLAAVIFRSVVWQTSGGNHSMVVEAILTLRHKTSVCWARATSWSSDCKSQEHESLEKQPVDVPRSDSWFLVWLLPALVAANLALLIAGHVCRYLHIHSTVECSLTDIPDRIYSPLNFIGTVSRSVHARAYLMALAVTLWVVVWPYVKLLATLAIALWVRSKHTKKDRSQAMRVLEGMNVVAKWSFVEVFFFCFAAMTTSMTTPTYEINPKLASVGGLDIRAKFGTFAVAANVELLPGAMAMIAAILLATVLTHRVVYELEPSDGTRVAAHKEHEHVPPLLAAIGALLFLLLGFEQSMLAIDRQGFLGNALGKNSKVDISVHSMIAALRGEPSLADQPTVQVLGVIAVFLTLVAPTLEMIFLIASLHWAKVQPGLSYRMRCAAGWLYSFDCIEVLLFNCLIVLCDFSNFMAYVMKDDCDKLKKFTTHDQLDKVGLLHLYDDDCLRVKSRLGLGFWLLLVVVVLRTIAWGQALKPQPADLPSEQAAKAVASA